MISTLAHSQAKIILKVADRQMMATLADNEATRQLISRLTSGPVTIQMTDYGGFEKVGSLPYSLPTSNSLITTEPGDIMLYQGDNIVIFYGVNSWQYTRLGKIENATENDIRQFLGNGTISLEISLSSHAGIATIQPINKEDAAVYDLNGKLVVNRPLSPGIYICGGKKMIVSSSRIK